MRHPKFIGVLVFLALLTSLARCHGAEPREALRYRSEFVREGRLVWGLNGPLPVMAAQVQQESRWNAAACSAFACGLAQFTPSTAKWISGAYPAALANAAVFNPTWAMRALFRYDHILYTDFGRPTPTSPCDQWAFALSAYNGGAGWINRDRELCSRRGPACNPLAWFGNVERYTARLPSAAKENRRYPAAILANQEPYSRWGRTVECLANLTSQLRPLSPWPSFSLGVT